MRGRLRFPGLRVGGTSWVTEGSLSENLRCLAGNLQDMELVLFDTPEASNIPSPGEVRELSALCSELDMTCTVHLPAEIDGTAPPEERRRNEDICLSVMERMAPLDPFGWVVHLTGERRTGAPSDSMERWAENLRSSAERLAAALDVPERFCVETLGYDLRLAEPAFAHLGLSVCLDVGHLVLYGFSPEEEIVRWLPRTRILHVHGVTPDGEDHRDLGFLDPGLLSFLLDRCAPGEPERVLTVEVFGAEDYRASLNVLKNRNGS